MKILKRRRATIVIILVVVIIISIIWWKEIDTLLLPGSYNDADSMVKTMMDKSATPGVAMVISKQGELEYKCYGYGDIKNKKRVNKESLFELGSTTKAFTALAIILLENEGHLDGSDYVSDYLPWFVPTYKGKQSDVTIDQLLAHTTQ